MTTNVSHFCANLKYFRVLKGFTQQQLATHLRIGKGNIARYERGEVIPKLDVVLKIASLLEVSLDRLCGVLSSEPSQLEVLATRAAKLDDTKIRALETVFEVFVG